MDEDFAEAAESAEVVAAATALGSAKASATIRVAEERESLQI